MAECKLFILNSKMEITDTADKLSPYLESIKTKIRNGEDLTFKEEIDSKKIPSEGNSYDEIVQAESQKLFMEVGVSVCEHLYIQPRTIET
jgi:hypothetical protein